MLSTTVQDDTTLKTRKHYSVEFFHIYTDETIGRTHKKSLEYLKTVRSAWTIGASSIVLIDNYNPKEHNLTPEDVLRFISGEGVIPDYWAFEGDVLDNAKKFLDTVTNRKLQKNYERYIEKHGKMPCSLLTATWYLTRLGVFDSSFIKSFGAEEPFEAADRLINILPRFYAPVEDRAFELILNSPYSELADCIQDLFYDASDDRDLDIF